MERGKVVRAQIQEGKPLAVVYDGAVLEEKLVGLLKNEGLRVMEIKRGEFFPVLSSPQYVFFFAKGGSEELVVLREALVTAKRNEAKVLVCLDNVSAEAEKMIEGEIRDQKGKVRMVEIRGAFERSSGEVVVAAGKLVGLAFSDGRGEGKLVLVGRKLTPGETGASYTTNVSDKGGRYQTGAPGWRKLQGRWRVLLTAVSVLIIVLFLPLFVSLVLAIWGGGQLRVAANSLEKGDYKLAQERASSGEEKFSWAEDLVLRWQFVWENVGLSEATGRYSDFLLLAKQGSDALSHLAAAAQNSRSLVLGITGSGEVATIKSISETRSELSTIERDILLMESKWSQASGIAAELSPILGVPKGKMVNVPDRLVEIRKLVSSSQEFLRVLPGIIGADDGGKRKYLLVFQNSSELRPTGGFIGSYAILDFGGGRLLDFKIHDIYSADGQLRGRIQPPDEILHFLGQPSWYMRDANWAADWPLSAQRLEWFLEKETGEKVDGVGAVSLPLVQKLLAATGPITLEGFGQTVSTSDFYQKAEYASEINFFPGSTQKRDFLGAVAQALWEKISGGEEQDLTKLARALGEGLVAKDLMLYFNETTPQEVIEEVGWGGTLVANSCGDPGTNCLALVEANMGANKANYFLKRSINIGVLVGKGGETENRITVTYENDSPNDSWPGGAYKNYLRFLVPVDSQMVGLDIGDGRKAKLSAVLTAEALRQLGRDQFLVFNNLELSAKSKNATGSAFSSYGTYVEVAAGTTKTVTFTYQPGYKMDFSSSEPVLEMTLLKQPGTGGDPLSLVVDFPAFLEPLASTSQRLSVNARGKPLESSGETLVFAQKLAYTTSLSQDRKLEFRFRKTLK